MIAIEHTADHYRDNLGAALAIGYDWLNFSA